MALLQRNRPSHSDTPPLGNLLRVRSNLAVLQLTDNTLIDRLIEDVNLRLGKVPSGDLSLKEEVQLSKCSSSWLWDAEIGVNDAQKAQPCPEEGGVVAPVPSGRIDHVRRQDVGNDTDDVVKIATQHNSLDLKATSRKLRDQRIADSSNRELIEERPNDHQAAGGQSGFVFVGCWDQSEET